MKKILTIMLTLSMLIGCSNHNTTTNKTDKNESAFATSAKEVLINKLEKKFKKGTKAENQTIVYEKDSICIIGFDMVYTFASGNVVSGRYEFVYSPKLDVQGFFIDIEKEPTAIDQCKQWMDEAEIKMSASEKENLGGFDDWMRYWIFLRWIDSDEFSDQIQEEYEKEINTK